MSEDEITEELVKEMNVIWSGSRITKSLVPISQKIDKTLAKNRGRSPTIDICFRDRWEKEVFFGFECKLLEEGDGRLYNEYIVSGLYRYLEGKYCSQGSAGSLIGYVKVGRLDVIIKEVKTRVDKEKILRTMDLAASIDGFKEHYVSTHSRDRGLPHFSVHHLFFLFDAK